MLQFLPGLGLEMLGQASYASNTHLTPTCPDIAQSRHLLHLHHTAHQHDEYQHLWKKADEGVARAPATMQDSAYRSLP